MVAKIVLFFAKSKKGWVIRLFMNCLNDPIPNPQHLIPNKKTPFVTTVTYSVRSVDYFCIYNFIL